MQECAAGEFHGALAEFGFVAPTYSTLRRP
jgi:hypothetical protein